MSVILEYQIFLFLIFTSFINIISAPITRTNIDIDKLKIVLTSNFIHFYQEILSTFNCCQSPGAVALAVSVQLALLHLLTEDHVSLRTSTMRVPVKQSVKTLVPIFSAKTYWSRYFPAEQSVGQTADYCIRSLISMSCSPHIAITNNCRNFGKLQTNLYLNTIQYNIQRLWIFSADRTIFDLAALHMLEKSSLFLVNNERFLS